MMRIHTDFTCHQTKRAKPRAQRTGFISIKRRRMKS